MKYFLYGVAERRSLLQVRQPFLTWGTRTIFRGSVNLDGEKNYNLIYANL